MVTFMQKILFSFYFLFFLSSYSLITNAMFEPEADDSDILYEAPENPIDKQIYSYQKSKSPYNELRIDELIKKKYLMTENSVELKSETYQKKQRENLSKHINDSKIQKADKYLASYIFIIDKEKRLYFSEKFMGNKNEFTHREKHTQLSDYESLRAAGEVIITNGKLTVTNRSDEYNCPFNDNFIKQVYEAFKNKEIWADRIVEYDDSILSEQLKVFNNQASLINELKDSKLLHNRRNPSLNN